MHPLAEDIDSSEARQIPQHHFLAVWVYQLKLARREEEDDRDGGFLCTLLSVSCELVLNLALAPS